MPTRDLGLNHGGAGKGDADRSDPKTFRERMQHVQFPPGTDEEKGFEKRGNKLVKRYGGTPPTTIAECIAIIQPPLPVPQFPPCIDKENSEGW